MMAYSHTGCRNIEQKFVVFIGRSRYLTIGIGVKFSKIKAKSLLIADIKG